MEKVSSLRILDGEPSKVSRDEVDALILPNISDAATRFGSGRVMCRD